MEYEKICVELTVVAHEELTDEVLRRIYVFEQMLRYGWPGIFSAERTKITIRDTIPCTHLIDFSR